ncbi:hypothetical protein CC80DRAFT_556223 [Byssothecium circinans]|uniref:Uncharacterized protein n=1 Tax=Byssothecium circinans TaxID=147558 RepID=A0A6A5T8L3_9PLEO|nr:hypothetical protein CC80DRAFT_556223 [Byssothecium circinans]
MATEEPPLPTITLASPPRLTSSLLPPKDKIVIAPIVICSIVFLLLLIAITTLHYRKNKPIIVPDNVELRGYEPEQQRSHGIQSAMGSVKQQQPSLPYSTIRTSSTHSRFKPPTTPGRPIQLLAPSEKKSEPRLYNGGIAGPEYRNTASIASPGPTPRSTKAILHGPPMAQHRDHASVPRSPSPPAPSRPDSPLTAMIRAKQAQEAERVRVEEEEARRAREQKMLDELERQRDAAWARQSERARNRVANWSVGVDGASLLRPHNNGSHRGSILSATTTDHSDLEDNSPRVPRQPHQQQQQNTLPPPRNDDYLNPPPRSAARQTVNSNTYTDLTVTPNPGDAGTVDASQSRITWGTDYRGSFVESSEDEGFESKRLPGDAY